MPLAPMSALLKKAEEHRFAVGYFEAWNLESLLAVKDAAEESSSPVIIGFNGGFLENHQRRQRENVFHYGALALAVAVQSTVPMAVILNEATRISTLKEALEAGFNVIMHDHAGCSFEEAMVINRELVEHARAFGAEVEAEIGMLPEVDATTGLRSAGKKTDVESAVEFVSKTKIDALAVAVGNVHVLESGNSRLDLALIKSLRASLAVRLVLHGGSGILADDLKEAIVLGISKVNVGTILRRAYVNTLKGFLESREIDRIDPGELTSTGGQSDMLALARKSVKDEVAKLMVVFGSVGKEHLYSKDL